MQIVIWAIVIILFVQLLFVVINVSFLVPLGKTGKGRTWLRDKRHSHEAPRLSVLIPARNEASNIVACVQSVCHNDSAALEVIVLDDHSTDGTGDLVRQAFAHDRRVSVIDGQERPDDWLGKAFACHQLAHQARGEWWLFLDADARLEQDALEAAMDVALAQGSGLVTGFPRQVTKTWFERLIVPLMNFTIACHLPIRLVRFSNDPRFVAAHGAFMLVQANSYRHIGGHEANKADLVDDMAMARTMKKAYFPVTLARLSTHVHMRMYTDARGVWNGYKKNIYAGVGRNSFLLFTMLIVYGILYIFPFVSLLFTYDFAALYAILLAVCIKFSVDRTYGQKWPYAFLLLPGMMGLILIGIASWWGAVSGRGYVWKGRRYH